MTNGEKFCIDFPNIRIEVFVSYVQVVGENYEFNNLYPLTWWNAEYKEPTTNNLGVDWDELKRKILMDIDGSTDDAWLAYGEVRNIIINSINEYVQNIKDLPSVTPQEPILDKVRAEIESKLDNINRLYNQDNQYDDGAIDSLQYALDIIDKYSECEGKK